MHVCELQIHYDNNGTDSGEGVEVIYPTSLPAAPTLALYDGKAGGNYANLTLAAGQPIGSTGFSVAANLTKVDGVQNGSPDGLALICGGTVIQFLSYEGTFTAVGGPASGSPSTDIVVAESGEALSSLGDCAYKRTRFCFVRLPPGDRCWQKSGDYDDLCTVVPCHIPGGR